MAVAGLAFMNAWAVIERAYRRPLGWLSRRLRFGFYPLLAVAMLGWLAWDAQHARALDAAEDAVFDQIIGWRPIEPVPSGRTVVVAIDDCSIDWYRALERKHWLAALLDDLVLLTWSGASEAEMASLGTRPARLARLYRTHPPLDARMDRLDAGAPRGDRRR